MNGRPTVLLRIALLAAVALVAHVPGRPAVAQVPTLDRVDSLVAAGSYEWARATLKQWWSARNSFDVPGSDRARALMLRGRLAPDIDAAEPDYLALVLGYPNSPHAPEALLRLGQGLLAAGEADRAAGYLRRLVADYPGAEQRARGLLWLARASRSAGLASAGCTAARQGLRDYDDPSLSELLRIEEAATCGAGGGAVARQVEQRPPAPPTPVEAEAADAGPAEPVAADAAAGSFAVQTGAFRFEKGANDLMARLREAGYEPRAVLVPRNDLLRIRVGRFQTGEEAARLVAELERQGFAAVVVRDADRERRP